MDRRNTGAGAWRGFVLALTLLTVAVSPALAGTSGKLTGHITDQKKQPLAGVNVIVMGMPLGAATDADGRYVVLNIPAGKISVKVALIGYRPVITQNVEINADNTTSLDVALVEAALELKEIVVSAHKAVVDIHRTSNIATVSREQLQALPVQELQDVVKLQAGVVDGHFRGGRDDEVQYQVDGVTVNNAYDNKTSLRLDRSLLEEVQVISGTFDAEYGQAMSGVVNAVLKRGGDKLRWDAEVYSGGPVYGAGSGRIVNDELRLASQQNYQLSLDGPTPLPHTTFLLSGNHVVDDSWIRGKQVYQPWDTLARDPNTGRTLNHAVPTGSGTSEALGFSHEYEGVLKLTNHSLKSVELSWQAIVDVVDGRNASWAYRYEPYGETHQHTLSVVEGLDLTHTLSTSRFYSLSVRQNYKSYKDLVFDSVWDPRYESYGQSLTYPDPTQYDISYVERGVDPNRFVQKTNGAVFKGSFVDQVAKDHQFKVGGEFQAPHVQFGAPGYLLWYADSSGTASTLHRLVNYDPKYPGVQEYRPFIGAGFAQEEVEWNDLTLRAGARLDFFDPRATYPSDLSNPANTIVGVPLSHPVTAKTKYALAPRLGVSYPISSSASLFFAYGHFYQFPALGQIFQYADYNRLADLQATDTSIPIMGNPNIRPEKTVQYQFGFKQAVTENLGLDVTAFYKDIRDLLGTQIIDTYNGAQYARLANVDFGSVVGFTLTLTQRATGLFGYKLDYTWQSAQGNSSDPNETATRAQAGEDAQPRSIPFDWDQRHTLNLTTTWARASLWDVSAVTRFSSGQPYTPTISTGFNSGLQANSGRKPNVFVVDVRAERRMSFLPAGQVFARAFNLFDTRFDNGFVFGSTGDPYYSAYPTTDIGTLEDPTRYFAPRRIEVGFTLRSDR